MSFDIKLDENKDPQPVLICDHCKTPIKNRKDGNFLWKWEDPYIKGGETVIYYTHKGCNSNFERNAPHVKYAVRELTNFIAI